MRCQQVQACVRSGGFTLCDPTDCGPFPRQEYGKGLPFPTPGDLPGPGIEPMYLLSPALAGHFFTTESPGKVSSLWLFSWLVIDNFKSPYLFLKIHTLKKYQKYPFKESVHFSLPESLGSALTIYRVSEGFVNLGDKCSPVGTVCLISGMSSIFTLLTNWNFTQQQKQVSVLT